MQGICSCQILRTDWAMRVFATWRGHREENVTNTILKKTFQLYVLGYRNFRTKNNHSLQATGTTAMFNASVPEKNDQGSNWA